MKTCELNCEKTCELFITCFLTCFSHLFHRVWNCWDFTGSEPMQNPVSFYPVKKPLKDPVKNLLKTCELSHCFSHGRKCQNLWKGHFSQGQNPACKTLWKTLWIFTLLKNLWKTLWTFTVFFTAYKCQNLWAGHFSQGQNLWKTLTGFHPIVLVIHSIPFCYWMKEATCNWTPVGNEQICF